MTTRLFDSAHVAAIRPNNKIKQLVRDAKKNKQNRVYYSNKFQLTDLRDLGIIQSDEKSIYDQVQIDSNTNESLEFYGFDQQGSHFNLSILIVSLFPNGATSTEESKWRLAKVDFSYINAQTKFKYTYKCEQLIDYEFKRNHLEQYDTKNLWKIGSLSIETVLPFSFTRILFNGMLTKSSPEGNTELVSAKLTISTHPSSDKFDYQDRFDEVYLSERLTEQVKLDSISNFPISDEKLLEMCLEDRIDQTMMFQGHLELLGTSRAVVDKYQKEEEKFMMWGAKLKRFSHPPDILFFAKPDVLRESLFMWTDCGLMVHLTRAIEKSNLVYGFINNAYEYSSPLNGVKYQASPDQEGGSVSTEGSCLEQLESFGSLKRGAKINLRGYKKKNYTIEILATDQFGGLMKINLNGFDGWAMIGNHAAGNLSQQMRKAQENLWTFNIVENKQLLANFSHCLASEQLLGGKGNSLIELNRLIKSGSLMSNNNQQQHLLSVPRGIVVSCRAYELWSNSNPKILKLIHQLDALRRTLAARSINLNPLTENYLTLGQKQQLLKEQCQKTHLELNSYPMPTILKDHLRCMLMKTFTKEELDDSSANGKLFAVRSSAVGEDSLETSAAGQMRTILDARGFVSICDAIVNCWSSQFELEAITYKSQNGLSVNLPMAVVVQELIQCQTAGVAATCDPLTGSKEKLEILANVGLGEGVVSGGKADTIRLSLTSLGWNVEDECCKGELSLADAKSCIEKVVTQNTSKLADSKEDGENQTKVATCCLEDAQIIALANLLLKLRQVSTIKDREIEWGITKIARSTNNANESYSSSSSSSSSSGSSSNLIEQSQAGIFHIHLLQSRPLTHLSKLSAQEIDHELDNGFIGALDIVSRANLGEVMPGVMSPLSLSHYLSINCNVLPEKPFEEIHTFKPFVATAFGTHGGLVCMVLTHSDMVNKFELKEDKTPDEDSALRIMIGHRADLDLKNLKNISKLNEEKMNPLSPKKRMMLLPILLLDSGYLGIQMRLAKSSLKKTPLEDDLISIDELIEAYCNNDHDDWMHNNNGLQMKIRASIVKLFERLCKQCQLIMDCWKAHVRGTILSMAFNMICLKILNKQPAYKVDSNDNYNSSEVLNDFSALVQAGANTKTESGDISHLLDKLIGALDREGKLELAKQMNTKELFRLLTNDDNVNGRIGPNSSSSLYERFMKKNGHRAFKEFDYATLTWADDPSYIIKSLAFRLKQQPNSSQQEQKADNLEANKGETERKRIDEILAKVVSGRGFLVSYVLPRARNATVRREKNKSLLIKCIDKYRKAFRHLGGLLCLQGRLPSVELIFQLTIEELERIVREDLTGCDLSAILYKARRRQQRARVMDKTAFAKPTLDFADMVETIRQFSEGRSNKSPLSPRVEDMSSSAISEKEHLVRGMTSCGGYVTGRAYVVSSPDDMDQIQPNDILITYSIDISWSVYFFTLAGIVTEVGGIVSHGAVVAREYGIPTLCTAVGACSVFKTGQLVTLDANQGICYLATTNEKQEEQAEGVNGVANVKQSDG